MASGFTPTKTSTHIAYTPNTKQTLCILCGIKVSTSEYRRRLFHGSTKTEHCYLIEKCLDITVSPELHTDIVCRKCIDNLSRANVTVLKHKQAYNQTIAKLKKTHGRETTKRLSSERESKPLKRKSLFPDASEVRAETVLKENASHGDTIIVSKYFTTETYIYEPNH